MTAASPIPGPQADTDGPVFVYPEDEPADVLEVLPVDAPIRRGPIAILGWLFHLVTSTLDWLFGAAVLMVGLAALAALQIIEWPVAVAVAVGHILASNHHSKTVQELGEAIETA